MAGIGSVVINFLTNGREAARDVDKLADEVQDLSDDARKADRAVDGLGDEIDDAGDKSRGAGGKIGGLTKGLGVGLVAGAGLALGAVGALADIFLDAARNALEEQQSVEKLRAELKRSAGATDKVADATEAWIQDMKWATNVADDDLRVALATLVRVTGDVKQAQRLAAAATDLAAVSGRDLADVAEILAEATTGETEELKSLAPWLDKNEDGTLTLAEALGVLEGKYSDAAESAADQDMWGTLKLIWRELKDVLSDALMPVLNRLRDWFKQDSNKQKIRDFIRVLSRIATEIGEKVVPKIEEMLEWLASDKWKKTLVQLRVWATQVKHYFMIIWHVIQMVIRAIQTVLSALSRLPSALPGIGGHSATATAGPSAATAATSSAAAPPVSYYREPTVIVTEEQVYRAVQRLIMRGDARNGRLVVAR